ncbi:sensor histidine kinase [Parapedobacter koreensis]|nr:histidine kinase [Parapedobacter koreensis]
MRTSGFPIQIWIKQGLLFSVTLTIYVMLSSYMEGLNGLQVLDRTTFAFLVFFCISMGNTAIYALMPPQNGVRLSAAAIGISSAFAILTIYAVHNLHKRLLSGYPMLSQPVSDIAGGKLYVYLALQAVLMNGVLLIWQHLSIMQYAKWQVELENSRLAKAKSEATNQLLRQQIHPHFLFNALSTLRALIRKDGNMAEAYLLRLADFLRVAVSSNPAGTATLRDEIKLCRDYLEMQKMRFRDTLRFSITVDESLMDHKLPLFAVQLLAENAIKHNQLTKSIPLSIIIASEGGWICVKNNIHEKAYIEASAGIGLANLAERYRMLSEEGIEIVRNSEHFLVKIKILSNERPIDRR